MRTRPTLRTRLLTVGLGLALAAGGCSSDPPHSARARRGPGSGATASRTVTVNVTETGCAPDPARASAGPLTFKVSNVNAAAVSEVELMLDERIVAEKEKLPPGFSSSLSLKLGGGSYRLYCPGATKEYADLTVSGKATSEAGSVDGLLARSTHDYAKYVDQQVGQLVVGVRRLSRAIRSGDLRAARIAYARARPYYERIEPVAQSNVAGKVNLDARIDARAGDVPAREWSGFHVIEKGLFATNSLARLRPVAVDLQKNVERLRSLTRGLTFQPDELLDGAGGLLDEVSKSRVTGEDERYSHIDLVDFQANVEGAEQAFADVEPGLASIDHSLAREIVRRFTGVKTLLARYVDPNALGGYLPYERLSAVDKRKMSNAVRAAKELLSNASSKVAAAG